MDLGKNIGTLRREKGLTQEDFANILGIATGSLQNYELNKRKPNFEILNKISNFFEVSLDELVNGASSIYINRLNRQGTNIKRDISEIPTKDLIAEINSRADFPIKIEIKNEGL